MVPRLSAHYFFLLTLLLVNSHQSSYSTPSAECPPYHNGSIADGSCNQEYSVCVNGVRQDATCIDGYVFYGTDCVTREESPECEAEDDDDTYAEDEPEVEFDCSSQPDGPYAVGCANAFFKCVAGYAYKMFCPADLVYNAHYDECLESCEVNTDVGEDEEEEETVATTAAPYTSESDDGEVYEDVESTEAPTTVGYGDDEPAEEATTVGEPEPVEFDCADLADGIYADGCSPYFYTCSNGVAYKKFCPQGTVFNPSQKVCDYDCVAVPEATTTTESYETTTTKGFEEPSTSTASEYTTTTELDVPSTTTEAEYTTTPQDDVPSTTESTTTTTTVFEYETTTPGFDDVVDPTTTTTTTTQAPIRVCQEGQVSTFGTCSSRFTRCQNNTVKSKQCPVDTLFETSLLMCVYDLPQCQPVTVPVGDGSTYSNNNNGYNNPSLFPQPDTVVSPFDENAHLRPRIDRRRGPYHHGPTYVDNPFFIPSHPRYGGRHHREERRHHGPHIVSPFSTRFHGRALLDDGFKDHRRIRMDKLQYGDARKVTGNKRFLIDDGFEGPKARALFTDIQRVFPMRGNRRLGPRYNPDAYEDGSGFEPKDLFGATRKKRSAYYGAQQTGYGQQATTATPQVSDRQAQVNQNCQSFTVPTYLTFGDCFDQFIYCSGNGINRMAACPIGESFDKTARACSETCGVAAPVVTVTQPTASTGTQTGSADDDVVSSTVYSGIGNDDTGSSFTTTSYTAAPGNDQPSTTPVAVGDRCSQGSSGLYAAFGCSQRYIQCSNGAAIVRECAASLYFNEASARCDYRDQIPQCQGLDNSSTASSVVTLPAEDQVSTDGYQYTTGPSQEQPSTTYSYGVTEPSDDVPSTTRGYGYTTTSSQDVPSTSGYSAPSDDSTSTTTGYGTPELPGDDQPTTYSPTVKPYNPTAPQPDVCAGRRDGSHGQGCSSSFIICRNNRFVKAINCALGEGFDPSVQNCRSFNQISAQACDQLETTTDAGLVQPLPYVTLEDALSTTTETTTTEEVGDDDVILETTTITDAYEVPTDAPAEDPTTVVVTDSYQRVADEDEEVSLEEEQKCTVGSRVAVGFCVKTYLECTSTGYIEKVCRLGKQYDTNANKCVPRIACGKDAIRQAVQDIISTASTTVSPKKVDGRCAHVDGEAVFALGSCSSNYVRCSYGSAKLQHCSGNKVFSNAQLECVSRESTAECIVAQNQPVKSYYNNHQQDAFCDGKADGLYGNKRDCSAILQCFGGELFEHPACPSNLAFNELTGKCDYPQKVSGCENHSLSVGECAEHGAFIADVNSCSTFYRCVWGRKVTQKCPSGTVFNPALSVCDWPSAVPSCSGPPAADDDDDNDSNTSTTTASAPYGTNYGY